MDASATSGLAGYPGELGLALLGGASPEWVEGYKTGWVLTAGLGGLGDFRRDAIRGLLRAFRTIGPAGRAGGGRRYVKFLEGAYTAAAAVAGRGGCLELLSYELPHPFLGELAVRAYERGMWVLYAAARRVVYLIGREDSEEGTEVRQRAAAVGVADVLESPDLLLGIDEVEGGQDFCYRWWRLYQKTEGALHADQVAYLKDDMGQRKEMLSRVNVLFRRWGALIPQPPLSAGLTSAITSE